jgi:hypothetical protein
MAAGGESASVPAFSTRRTAPCVAGQPTTGRGWSAPVPLRSAGGTAVRLAGVVAGTPHPPQEHIAGAPFAVCLLFFLLLLSPSSEGTSPPAPPCRRPRRRCPRRRRRTGRSWWRAGVVVVWTDGMCFFFVSQQRRVCDTAAPVAHSSVLWSRPPTRDTHTPPHPHTQAERLPDTMAPTAGNIFVTGGIGYIGERRREMKNERRADGPFFFSWVFRRPHTNTPSNPLPHPAATPAPPCPGRQGCEVHGRHGAAAGPATGHTVPRPFFSSPRAPRALLRLHLTLHPSIPPPLPPTPLHKARTPSSPS